MQNFDNVFEVFKTKVYTQQVSKFVKPLKECVHEELLISNFCTKYFAAVLPNLVSEQQYDKWFPTFRAVSKYGM